MITDKKVWVDVFGAFASLWTLNIRRATLLTLARKMEITRSIGREAQRSALGYLAMASIFTIPFGLVLTLMGGWPAFIVTISSHIFPACFVWATADVLFAHISRNFLLGLAYGILTLAFGGLGFYFGLVVFGSHSPLNQAGFVFGFEFSMVITSIFVVPALFFGGLISLRFRDIYGKMANKPRLGNPHSPLCSQHHP